MEFSFSLVYGDNRKTFTGGGHRLKRWIIVTLLHKELK
jgi:hypothetical protein